MTLGLESDLQWTISRGSIIVSKLAYAFILDMNFGTIAVDPESYNRGQTRIQRGGMGECPPAVGISENFNKPSEILTFDGKPWKIIKREIFYF